MRPAEESLAAELSQSGSRAWGNLKTVIVSQVTVDFERDGEFDRTGVETSHPLDLSFRELCGSHAVQPTGPVPLQPHRAQATAPVERDSYWVSRGRTANSQHSSPSGTFLVCTMVQFES